METLALRGSLAAINHAPQKQNRRRAQTLRRSV
jgi:hypothetical protein